MREIKFRGKKKNGSWLFGDLVQRPPIALIFPLDATDSQDNYIVDLKTVGQFTGLTDKNGVEIYEGDFLEGFKYPVTFEDGCFCATIQYDLVRCWLNSENCNLENLEVIGNVHDNQKLINNH